MNEEKLFLETFIEESNRGIFLEIADYVKELTTQQNNTETNKGE